MFTRYIYPLFLREKISYRVQKFYTDLRDREIPLEFNKNIYLDLSKHDIWHKSIIFKPFYELELSKVISRLASKGGVLVNVGANYGYFSCLWASENSTNKLLAYEASPANRASLLNNLDKIS